MVIWIKLILTHPHLHLSLAQQRLQIRSVHDRYRIPLTRLLLILQDHSLREMLHHLRMISDEESMRHVSELLAVRIGESHW